ncbi:Zinc finger protein 26, partial [Armadillidium nasatum]
MHKIAAHGTRKKKSDSDGSSDGNCNTSDESYSFHKMWQCNECTFVYFSKKELSDHRKSFHGKIINEDSQREHRREKIYSCNSCNLTFTYKYELEKHRETHLQFHKVGPHEFICHICGLKVASKAALKIHVHRFHTKDTETKDYLCAECGHMTSTKKSFADHLRIHSDIPGQKKVCHLCKKEMLSTSFKIHMIRMHGEAKHPCDICGQRFTLRSVLMKHLNTVHSTLTPYDCRLCSKKFVTAEALRYHKNKSHSSAMHSCMNCGKSFKWKGDLRSHMNKVHNIGTLRHTCEVCSRSFTDKRKLQLHISLIHNRATIKENAGDDGSKCSGRIVTQYESEEH